jgi:ribosome-associated protein
MLKTPFGSIPFSDLAKEFEYKAVRSSGAGGQHVNKVSTKVIASFNIQHSTLLTQEEKLIIEEKLASKIAADGNLSVYNEASRSQHTNKENATKTLTALIERAFKKPKPRKQTQPTLQAKKARAKSKQLHSEKKQLRNIRLTDILSKI